MTTNQSTSSSDDSLKCKWCDKSFVNERTLSAHMCVKKRRWNDKDLTYVRLGFTAFQKFYKMATAQNQPKTMIDFIHSPYYTDFVKFGRSCVRNQYIDPKAFIEYLIKNSKKITLWSQDKTYNEFFLQYIKKEPGMKAFERTVTYLSEWSKESEISWNKYFKEATPVRAVYDIRAGNISPWVVYLSETGRNLIERFNEEQTNLIKDIMDDEFWLTLFVRNKKDVAEIQEICKIYHL